MEIDIKGAFSWSGQVSTVPKKLKFGCEPFVSISMIAAYFSSDEMAVLWDLSNVDIVAFSSRKTKIEQAANAYVNTEIKVSSYDIQ